MAERFDKLLRADETVADRLAVARALLAKPQPADRAWPAVAAAAFLAVSALTFAAVVVLAPVPQSLADAQPD